MAETATLDPLVMEDLEQRFERFVASHRDRAVRPAWRLLGGSSRRRRGRTNPPTRRGENMQSKNSTNRTTLRWRRHVPAIALLVAGFALALPVHADSGRGQRGWGGPDGWIERHAEEIGIDDATLAEINRIVAASREEADAIYEEHAQARDVMHALLDQDEPDSAAVMKQADVIGEIDVRKHKHRLATMLKIRAKLTPEQRSELRAMKDEMHERPDRHGEHHCGGGEGCRGGEGCQGDGPPGQPEDL